MRNYVEFVLGLVFGFLMIMAPASANDVEADGLSIEAQNAWIRPSGSDSRPSAGYMILLNHSSEGIGLISASSPLASRIMIHSSVRQNNVMTMEHIMRSDIPAGGSLDLAPGGLHLMIFGLDTSKMIDGYIPITLTFADDQTLNVQFKLCPTTTLNGC